MELRVKNGEIKFIHNDDLAESFAKQGIMTTKRASNVEPCSDGWKADLTLVSGPILGPFMRRDEALKAEVDWLLEHKIPLPSEA